MLQNLFYSESPLSIGFVMDIWFGDEDESASESPPEPQQSQAAPPGAGAEMPTGGPEDIEIPDSFKMEDEEEETRPLGPPDYRLDKSDFLLGKYKKIPVHIDSLGKDVFVRPLTDGELSQIFSILSKKTSSTPQSPSFNQLDISTNLRTLRRVCAIGLVEPELTAEEVSHLPFGVPGFLAKRILELSGLYENAGNDAIEFAKSPEGKELASITIDHGYQLAQHPKDLTRAQINFLIAVMNRRSQTQSLIESMGGDEEGGTMILFPD